MSLALTRTIVDRGGKGFVEFKVQDARLPSASELKDDQVQYITSGMRPLQYDI